jgi:predicted dehydrogenase
MDNKITIGVVGCGYWGPNLVRNFWLSKRCWVKTICDTDEGRLSHMKGIYTGVHTVKNYEDLVADSDINAVAIATPVHLHYDMAKAALQAGKHVYIEKPMASTADQCRELNAMAGEQDLTLMVGHTFVYSTAVRTIKFIVESGDIGQLYYISSNRLNLGLIQKDINVAWDLAPHDISIILYITGVRPHSVNCQGRAHVFPGIEDVSSMSLEFPNDIFASIQSSWLDPKKVRTMTFVGNKKMILYDDTEPLEKIKIYDRRVDVPPHYDSFGEFQFSYHYGDVRSPHLNQVEPLKVLCADFLDAIESKTKPLSSGAEGLEVVKILEAASESLRKNGANIKISQD